jgi:hypothetical protein
VEPLVNTYIDPHHGNTIIEIEENEEKPKQKKETPSYQSPAFSNINSQKDPNSLSSPKFNNSQQTKPQTSERKAP